jgi:hypothetical protein
MQFVSNVIENSELEMQKMNYWQQQLVGRNHRGRKITSKSSAGVKQEQEV